MNACRKYGIELREADTFYPSSKMCSCCGYAKKNLSLSKRIFHCEFCGNEIDRDFNAAINLMQAKYVAVLTSLHLCTGG
ncbi:zinc ribbon domain-containing protein [Thermoflavimicrobium dichotomicum]|uniref:zinc ribbon domain-containing protein n=1 Tax=Thermoflavimicrobium dichotomicum TaxID=46223 RepID=UPI000B85B59C